MTEVIGDVVYYLLVRSFFRLCHFSKKLLVQLYAVVFTPKKSGQLVVTPREGHLTRRLAIPVSYVTFTGTLKQYHIKRVLRRDR